MKRRHVGLIPARIILAALGAAMIALTWCNPYMETRREDINGSGRVKLGPVASGESLTQSFALEAGDVHTLSIRAEDISEAEGLTLTLAVTDSGKTVATRDFPLAGLKKRPLLDMTGLALPAGNYLLTVSAAGEGSVTLNGSKTEEDPAQWMGEALEAGLFIRTERTVASRNVQVIYMGATLLLLSLTPVWQRRRYPHEAA